MGIYLLKLSFYVNSNICEIKIINNKNTNKVKWFCDEYLRDDGDEDCWLMNPQWKVRPTTAFMDGNMKV